jgi:proteasome lid subunit RPN8/RPN11
VALGDLWQQEPTPGLPSGAALPEGETLACRIEPRTEADIVAHAAEHPGVEVAGLLIGDVYEERGVRLVDVTATLRAHRTIASLGHVTFTVDTWLDLIAKRDELAGKVVGWYHSHPGHGVFLSGADRFVHDGFFGGASWYLALVVDPTSGERGLFAAGGRPVARCTTEPHRSEE